MAATVTSLESDVIRAAILRACIRETRALLEDTRRNWRTATDHDARNRWLGRVMGTAAVLSTLEADLAGDNAADRPAAADMRAVLLSHYTNAEAFDWLFAPHPQLDGEPPFDVIEREGGARVYAILSRLSDGVHL